MTTQLRENQARRLDVSVPHLELLRAARIINGRYRRALARSGKPAESNPVTIDADGRARFGGVTGFVRIAGETYEILPKFSGEDPQQWRQVLGAMLSVGGRMAAKQVAVLPGTVGAGLGKEGFLEPVARYFAEQLRRALDDHPLTIYQRQRQENAWVRGRIVMSRQALKPPHRQHLVTCDYSKRVRENPLVDLLGWAAKRLRATSTVPSTRYLLSECLERLGHLRDPSPSAVSRMNVPRTSALYAPALHIARDMYQGHHSVERTSRNKSHGVLIRTDKFFEAFVSGLFRGWAQNEGHHVEPQNKYPLAVHAKKAKKNDENAKKNDENAKKDRFTQPDDVVLRDKEEVRLVSDAKYKGSWVKNNDKSEPKKEDVRLVSDAKYKGSWVKNKNNDKWEPKNEQLDRADLYQLVSTCLACNCGHGLIVRPRLPSTNGKARTFELWTVPVNNLLSQEIRIGVVWLDLSRPTGREWRNQLISELGVAIKEVGLKP